MHIVSLDDDIILKGEKKTSKVLENTQFNSFPNVDKDKEEVVEWW